MNPSLRNALFLTDVLFLVYWLVSVLNVSGILSIPADWLYADAHIPRVIAWNWSFLPLDVAFSLTGLAAVRASVRSNPRWKPMALISLVLTMVAGGMAIGYWTILGEFNPAWFLPNLAIFVWPLFFLPGLVAGLATTSR